MPASLLPSLAPLVSQLTAEFDSIPVARKNILHQLADVVSANVQQRQPSFLNFICTHNSRRSHLAQLWAQTAAWYYGIPQVMCFSGGTEATAFNPRAVTAMREAGFQIDLITAGDNPVYQVHFAPAAPPVVAFSKKYDDPFNAANSFVAIMTCSHADENCPLVLGASARIAITYDDPKDFDGTPLEGVKYAERVREIGREILYAFSQIKTH